MLEEFSELGLEVHYLPIRVNEKILLHLGAGSYPSVAGVIKELVNNAFDADAEQVIISIGYSNFDEIRVFDTGVGMSLERFKMALVSIGNSMKDTIDQRRVTKKFRRPIIGRFGIGLIGLSQICEQVIIESQEPGAKTKFAALIDFTQFQQNDYERTSLSVLSSRYGGTELLRRQLDEPGLEPERREELELRLKLALKADLARQDKGFGVEHEHLGHCWFVPELPALPHTPGTYVILLGIRPEIKQALMGAGRPTAALLNKGIDWEQYLNETATHSVIGWSWRELCEKMRLETDGLTMPALPSYHQFLYELALMSPIPYLDDGPISIRPEVLLQKRKELKGFNFSVKVDNRTLYKPILLPSGSLTKQLELKDAEDYLITLITFDDRVPADGSRLRYHGYLYWQKSQNKPSAIRGIQLYIRNVGIGLYDETLLNFSKAHNIYLNGQLSGEIYVEEGLERALNVDRRSFRETDPHYVALQQHIFLELEAVLEKSMEADKQRQKVKATAFRKQHVAQLSKWLASATNGKLNLTIGTNGAAHPVEVHNNRLLFDLESDRWAGTQSERLLY